MFWILVAVAIVLATISVVLTVSNLRGRNRASRGQKQQQSALQPDSVAINSAESIVDGGGYSARALQRALAVQEESHGPIGDLPHDLGWIGTMLGLQSQIGDGLSTATVYWGDRPFGQVFVRIGPEQEQITVLRASSPVFVLHQEGHKPALKSGTLLGIAGVLGRIEPAKSIWAGFNARGGPEGLVCSRPLAGQEDYWAYDLWLIERIARNCNLPALGKARIGPEWTVPYALGRKLRSPGEPLQPPAGDQDSAVPKVTRRRRRTSRI